MKLEGVRTRFAPSPTGYMHVGNLRTALYAYLMAKSQNGTFILRIEDTDQERYVEGAVDIIYNTLKEAGLYWDEGPDIGGPVGALCPERAHVRRSESWLPIVSSSVYMSPSAIKSAAPGNYSSDSRPYSKPVYSVSPVSMSRM